MSDIRSQYTYYLISGGGSPNAYGDIRGNMYVTLVSQDPVTNTSVVRVRLRTNYNIGSSGSSKSMSTRATDNRVRYYITSGSPGSYGSYTSFNSKDLVAGALTVRVDQNHTITHDANGNATLSGGAQFGFNVTQRYTYSPEGVPVNRVVVHSGTRACSFQVALPQIPRPGTITSYTATAGTNNISVSWAYDKSYSAIQYNIGSGWVGTSGTSFNIAGLSPNTTYSVSIRVQDQASGIWVTSAAKSVKTIKYPGLTVFNLAHNGMNSIKVTWDADEAIKAIQYKIDGGAWTTGSGYPDMYIPGRAANTTYNIQIRIQSTASDLWTESSIKSIKTQDFGRFSSVPTKTDTETPFKINIVRNGGSTIEVAITSLDNATTYYGYSAVSGTEKTITLSEAQKNDIYTAMGNNKSIKLRLNLRTTNGGYDTPKEITFEISDANPTFTTFTYADVNTAITALTGNSKYIVKGYSTVRATISSANKAIAKKMGSISGYKLEVGTDPGVLANYSSSTVTMDSPNATSGSIKVTATDNRQFSTTVEMNIGNDFIPYEKPTIASLSVVRTSEVGEQTKLVFSGTYFSPKIGGHTNAKIGKYRYKITSSSSWSSWTTITLTASSNNLSYNANINGDKGASGFEVANSYNIEFVLEDSLSSVTRSTILNSGSPSLAIHTSGIAVAQPYDETLGGALQVRGQIKQDGYNVLDTRYTPSVSVAWGDITGKPSLLPTTGGTLTGNLSIVRTGTSTDTTLVVSSERVAGIYLRGDSSNLSGEPGGAYLAMGLDGYNVGTARGFLSAVNAAGGDGMGGSLTGTSANSVVLGVGGTFPLHFAQNGEVVMTLTAGNLGIGVAPSTSYKIYADGYIRGTRFYVGSTRKDNVWDAKTNSAWGSAPSSPKAGDVYFTA